MKGLVIALAVLLSPLSARAESLAFSALQVVGQLDFGGLGDVSHLDLTLDPSIPHLVDVAGQAFYSAAVGSFVVRLAQGAVPVDETAVEDWLDLQPGEVLRFRALLQESTATQVLGVLIALVPAPSSAAQAALGLVALSLAGRRWKRVVAP